MLEGLGRIEVFLQQVTVFGPVGVEKIFEIFGSH